ncbi:hypothetical protein SVIO_026530 [Streptomyces violaceusniger]|uniref:Beta-ketoacyl synthase-like N-terminal domain-containing protein n=1 Tax=Streptomyces violaceusniger TaxID=68280 RepID=A0A4D4KZQ7_STRVO|nr:hypothetical protein SVIO_026530 [Streptomyces violaceusniger]
MTTVGLPEETLAGGAVDPDTAIAVIGVSCRFPRAESPQRLWELLASGESAVTEVPPDRWTGPASHEAPRWGAFLDRPADFDAGFFGLSPARRLSSTRSSDSYWNWAGKPLRTPAWSPARSAAADWAHSSA